MSAMGVILLPGAAEPRHSTPPRGALREGCRQTVLDDLQPRDRQAVCFRGTLAGRARRAVASLGASERRGPTSSEIRPIPWPRMTVAEYHRELTERLRAILGERLLGVYASGSFGLDDFDGGRSDLDVFAVCRGAVTGAEKRARGLHRHTGARNTETRGRRVTIAVLGCVHEHAGRYRRSEGAATGTLRGQPWTTTDTVRRPWTRMVARDARRRPIEGPSRMQLRDQSLRSTPPCRTGRPGIRGLPGCHA